MEPEELEARAYRRNRSRGQTHPDDDLMQQEKGENSELSEAAGNDVDEQQRRNYYHPSDAPFDRGNPGGRRDDLGQMSLDQSKERDPTILAPQQHQVAPGRMQLEPYAHDIDQLQEQVN